MTVNRATAGFGALALALGVILLVLADGLVLRVLGLSLLGLSGIAFMALVFLLVGQSEERDRVRHPRG